MPNTLIYNNKNLYEVLLQVATTLPSCELQHITDLSNTSAKNTVILITNAQYLEEINQFFDTQNTHIICLAPANNEQDYANCKTIKKPYHAINIVEEIQNFLSKDNKSGHYIEIGNFLFDPIARKLIKESVEIILTEKEAKLVMLLHSCGGQISRDEILKEVWGFDSDIDTHTVETHIYRIRQKVGKKDDFIGSSIEGYFLSKSLI